MSVVYNGSKNNYYTCAGATIASTTQPDVNSGAVAGVNTTSIDSSKLIGKTPGDPIRQASSVIYTSTSLVTGSKPGGNVAYQGEGEYVVMGAATIKLNGASNTALATPGASIQGSNKSLHPMTAARVRKVATAIRAGYWNIYSGAWSTSPATGNDYSTMGTDDAAAPTRAVPGELTYMYGYVLPATGEYSSKTS